MKGISAVVPVYQSESSLEELCGELAGTLSGIGMPYEIVLVEDGGKDGAWDVIRRLAASDPKVRGIRLSRNYGQHNALLCGIREARHEIILTLDDDLQHPPSEIPKLLAKLQEGYDVVYGTPSERVHGRGRLFATKAAKWALKNLLRVGSADYAGAFRLFRASLREGFAECRGSYVSVDVLLGWCTDSFASVPVHLRERKFGRSHYGLGKLVAHTFNMVTGYSAFPLQIASWIGFFFTLFGIGVLTFVLARYLWSGRSVPGFAFLASIIAIFSGAQLFTLGIFGEYLARMYYRMLGRPTYVVKARAGQGD